MLCFRAHDQNLEGSLWSLWEAVDDMFDRWYPDMIWHVWCKRMLLVVRCNVFVMFEHVPFFLLQSRTSGEALSVI